MPIELNWIELNCIELNYYVYVDIVTPVFQNEPFPNLKFLDKFNFKIPSTFQNIAPYVLLCHLSYLFVSVNCFSSYWYSNKYCRAGTCLQRFTRTTYNCRHSCVATPTCQAIILRIRIFLLSDARSPTEILRKIQVVFFEEIVEKFSYFFLWSTLLTLEHVSQITFLHCVGFFSERSTVLLYSFN